MVRGSNVIVVSSNDDCQELLEALEKGKDCNSEMPFESAVAPYTILIHNQRSDDINKILTMVPDSVEGLLIIGATGGEVKLNGLIKRNLSDLKIVQVTHCQLKEVPSDVFSHLGNLELLNLSHNRLKELPETVEYLGNLREIHLQDNRLEKIPDGIGSLHSLEVMNLAQNNLSQLPITVVGHLRKCNSFSFDDNPLTLMTGRNIEDILRYLEALSKGAVSNTEFKLHVIGDAGVGKTTMIDAMRNKNRVSTTKTNKTKGIDVCEIKMNDLQCRVFDTGGDVEFLETHMLFTSSNTIYQIVFNLAEFGFGKDRLGRLETWLQAIYIRDPNARVTLVGTHADNPKVSKQVRDCVRKDVAQRLMCGHPAHRQKHEGNEVESCFLCQPVLTLEGASGDSLSKGTGKKISEDDLYTDDTRERKDKLENSNESSLKESVSKPCSINIPHVVGYFEISSIQKFPSAKLPMWWKKNQSLSQVMNCVKSEGEQILVKEIPHKWNEMKKALIQKSDETRSITTQPVMSLTDFQELAMQYLIPEEEINALIVFLMNTGYLVYHQAVSDMVIFDPKWLSDQLCTLISFDSNAVNQGFLDHSKLIDAWRHIPQDYHGKLLRLFRNISVCFSVDDVTELFPCKLPIGLPDPDTWPPEPDKNQKQLTHIHEFSFLPLDLFTRYITAVNTKKEEFHRRSTPFYSSNHVVYVTTKSPTRCTCPHGTKTSSDQDSEPVSDTHRVHTELIPYESRIAVTVRGSHPCCVVQEVDSVIKSLAGKNVTVETTLACPRCLIQDGLLEPIDRDPRCEDTYCKKNHNSGKWHNVVVGRLCFEWLISDQIRRLDEGLDDKECPRLFAILPVNKDALPLMDRVVYTMLKEGLGVHLMCESPDGPHFTSAPGLRLSKPKEFLEKHGPRVYKVLRYISQLETPLNLVAKGAALPPLATAAKGAAMAGKGATALKKFLEDFEDEYPNVAKQAEKIDLLNPKKAEGLERRELARMLNHKFDRNQDQFGGLYPTRIHTSVKWLCKKHHKEYSEAEK